MLNIWYVNSNIGYTLVPTEYKFGSVQLASNCKTMPPKNYNYIKEHI